MFSGGLSLKNYAFMKDNTNVKESELQQRVSDRKSNARAKFLSS